MSSIESHPLKILEFLSWNAFEINYIIVLANVKKIAFPGQTGLLEAEIFNSTILSWKRRYRAKDALLACTNAVLKQVSVLISLCHSRCDWFTYINDFGFEIYREIITVVRHFIYRWLLTTNKENLLFCLKHCVNRAYPHWGQFHAVIPGRVVLALSWKLWLFGGNPSPTSGFPNWSFLNQIIINRSNTYDWRVFKLCNIQEMFDIWD